MLAFAVNTPANGLKKASVPVANRTWSTVLVPGVLETGAAATTAEFSRSCSVVVIPSSATRLWICCWRLIDWSPCCAWSCSLPPVLRESSVARSVGVLA
jgi:hypothetical protein